MTYLPNKGHGRLLFEFHSTPFQFLHDFRGVFEFRQRLQVTADVGPVKLFGLPDYRRLPRQASP